MTVRRIFFWGHLITGVIAGLFIFIMAATGVLLTYEHRIGLALTDGIRVEATDSGTRLTADELAASDLSRNSGRQSSLTFDNHKNAVVLLKAGRSNAIPINPFTGEALENPARPAEDFFSKIEEIHRWFAAEGENRTIARGVTGAANLAFILLTLSGLYLWLPKAWKWAFFKLNLFFRKSYPSAKARDYNWHHVFGVWALIPLFLVSASGAVFSYPWANKLVYAAFGEEAPQRRGPPSVSGGNGEGQKNGQSGQEAGTEALASLQDAVDAAQGYGTKPWTRIVLNLPANVDETTLTLERHDGDRILPRQRQTLTFDRVSGTITKASGVADMTDGQKARLFLRFVHTGETFGFLGATIAGLASFAACFLVWTGFALAWRRLVQPAFRKKVV